VKFCEGSINIDKERGKGGEVIIAHIFSLLEKIIPNHMRRRDIRMGGQHCLD
jgi:hypothetical protein